MMIITTDPFNYDYIGVPVPVGRMIVMDHIMVWPNRLRVVGVGNVKESDVIGVILYG